MASSSDENISMFRIVGNIKQRFLPFVINPNAKINGDGFENCQPQLFTYKNNQQSDGGVASLGFYPATSLPNNALDDMMKSSNKAALDKDISLRLLYGSDTENSLDSRLKIDDIISTLPGVSIREFLPDTRLDQCLNFFIGMAGKTSEVMQQSQNLAQQQDSKGFLQTVGNIVEKLWECSKFLVNYMVGNLDGGNSSVSFLNDIPDIDKGIGEGVFNDPKDKLVKYIHNFPFVLYYRMQQCTTTNVYEVPAVTENKTVLNSDGTAGWGSGDDFMSKGGLMASDLLQGKGFLSKAANLILNNIGINYMPFWDAKSGTGTAAPEVALKFDLFNDNVIKAVWNFIFVNTLAPSNRWLQYNMFQHSTNLYDVKIDGLTRLFACSASFNVTYEGVLRTPSYEFFQLLKKHVNTNMYSDPYAFILTARNNNLIKIPDIYRVNMSFKSVMPHNFNNYLFTYTQNMNHMTDIKVRNDSIAQNINKGLSKFKERIEQVWEYEDADAYRIGDSGDDNVEDNFYGGDD